jgi:hypothetical protein
MAARMYCPNCGTWGSPKTYTKGSFALEVLLWLCLLVPGLLYSVWRLASRYARLAWFHTCCQNTPQRPKRRWCKVGCSGVSNQGGVWVAHNAALPLPAAPDTWRWADESRSCIRWMVLSHTC